MIKFEMLKVIREKSVYVLLLLLMSILIVPIFFLNNGQSFKYSQYETRLNNNQADLAAINNNPEAKKVIAEIEQENIYFEEALNALKRDDTENLTKVEYNLEVAILNSMKEGSLVGTPQIEQEKRVAELDYLISHKIDQVDYSVNKIPAINYIYYVLSEFLPYIYLLFVPFIIIANFSTAEKRKKTIDFFNLSPVSSFKKLLTKIVVTTTSALLLVYISFLASFLISWIRNGLGDFGYPIPKISIGGNVEIISISTFVFQAIILFSMLVIFFSLFSFFISLFTGNIIVNIFILISVIFISGLKITSNKFSITNLLDFPNIISGGTTYNPLPNSEITFNFSVISIFCYIVIISILIGATLKIKKGSI